MKAALELERWTFLAPIGYINVPRTYGKSLIPDPERAPVVQHRHGSKVEEFDVEGILNFAERVRPRASDLWIQASLEQRQRLQRLFRKVAFSGNAFDRTVVISSLFEYLRPPDVWNENLVDQTGASWNRIVLWMRQLESLRRYEAPSPRF
jgi:hypothetical protein